jgi:hypothetical protein
MSTIATGSPFFRAIYYELYPSLKEVKYLAKFYSKSAEESKVVDSMRMILFGYLTILALRPNPGNISHALRTYSGERRFICLFLL